MGRHIAFQYLRWFVATQSKSEKSLYTVVYTFGGPMSGGFGDRYAIGLMVTAYTACESGSHAFVIVAANAALRFGTAVGPPGRGTMIDLCNCICIPVFKK